VLAICLTEPDAGTDVPNYKTNSQVKGDRVIVKGREDSHHAGRTLPMCSSCSRA
jgi:alkylation response protein AidB-like acyl-CoA dehydrogenase